MVLAPARCCFTHGTAGMAVSVPLLLCRASVSLHIRLLVSLVLLTRAFRRAFWNKPTFSFICCLQCGVFFQTSYFEKKKEEQNFNIYKIMNFFVCFLYTFSPRLEFSGTMFSHICLESFQISPLLPLFLYLSLIPFLPFWSHLSIIFQTS